MMRQSIQTRWMMPGWLCLFLTLFAPISQADLFTDKLGFGVDKRSFLPVDEAFVGSIEHSENDTLIARWHIEEGYYLYKDKFQFTSQNPSITISSVGLPTGKVKNDPLFGKVEVYYGDIEIPLQITRSAALQESGQGEQNLDLEVASQGCAEDGICYPPIKNMMSVALAANVANPNSKSVGIPVPETLPETSRTQPTTEPASDQSLSNTDSIAASLAEKPLLISLALFFGFGLALSLTPCVFPMIPILSGILVGQLDKGQITTRKSFALSLAYVLGMALTYAVIGVIAGSFGKNLQAAFQAPWVLVCFSAVFVILALSMFGFYNIQLPSSWQTRLSSMSENQQTGSLQGAALMGIFSAIIVGPCVAPPLAGALIYIGQSGNALLGGIALFIMGLGMGVPLLLLGASAGKLLPRAGVWMESVKHVFGVMMLGVAIWLLERILPAPVTLALWGCLLIGSAVFMGALHTLTEISSGWQRLWKALGIVLLLYGTLLIIGAASKSDDVFHPLKYLTASHQPESPQSSVTHFQQIKGLSGLEAAIQSAQVQNRPLMLDFYADWCIECKRMEKNTFTDPVVQQQLANMMLVQADVTPNDTEDQALLRSFELYGPPAILFFDPNGKEQRHLRITGYADPESFSNHIKKIFP